MKHYGMDEGKAFLRTVALTFRVFDRRYEERPIWRMRSNAGYDALGSEAGGPFRGVCDSLLSDAELKKRTRKINKAFPPLLATYVSVIQAGFRGVRGNSNGKLLSTRQSS